MGNKSVWRLQGRFAGPALFTLLVIPATILAFAVSISAGLTFSGLSFTPILHVHTALASLWIVMLAGQAWLARHGNRALHRMIGRASYAIAPLIFASFVLVYVEQLGRRPYPYDQLALQFDVYNWFQSAAFLLCWALAIRHRKNTPRHLRYMIATVFAIGSAIVFRILMNWFAWIPGLADNNVLVIANGLLLMLPLLWLIRRDNKQGITPSPYWIPFWAQLLTAVGFFSFARTETWGDFVDGFARLTVL